MAVIKASQGFEQIRLYYDAALMLGASNERVEGVTVGPWGFSFGGSAGLVYSPIERMLIRFAFSFGQTVRELIVESAGGTSGSDASTATKTSSSSSYWWLTTTLSVQVRL
jgi:hypothetical protein